MLLRTRNRWISFFIVVWISLFHYETLRMHYLSPLIGRPLPKLKFLYPPAGWIMFFSVDRSYGFAEVYGIKRGQPTLFDPHRIFSTRFVGYDNIRRNVLVAVVSPERGPAFCGYLARKFPDYDQFAVVYGQYMDLVEQPDKIGRRVMYRCGQ